MEAKLPANIEEALLRLNEGQLKLLNRIVVERLKLLYKAKSLKQMAKYSTGDRVFFVNNDGEKIYGRIIRLNQKTISILTDDNHRWNVAPSYLTLDNKVHNEPNLFESEQYPEAPPQKRNVTPEKQATGKVGRNDPCPCGSGKKYKRCCG